MKFGMVNKSLTLNRFVLHTLHRNITHLAVITRKTNIKLGILKGGTGKEPNTLFKIKFERGDWKRAVTLLVNNCRWGEKEKEPKSQKKNYKIMN